MKTRLESYDDGYILWDCHSYLKLTWSIIFRTKIVEIVFRTVLKQMRKTGYFQIIVTAVWCDIIMSMKLGTSVKQHFHDILNKSARICLNILRDTGI